MTVLEKKQLGRGLLCLNGRNLSSAADLTLVPRSIPEVDWLNDRDLRLVEDLTAAEDLLLVED